MDCWMFQGLISSDMLYMYSWPASRKANSAAVAVECHHVLRAPVNLGRVLTLAVNRRSTNELAKGHWMIQARR